MLGSLLETNLLLRTRSDRGKISSVGGKNIMAKPASELENVMDNIPFYEKWQLEEGIPVIKTFFVQDLRKVELKPWARTGGNGAFINMEGAEGATGAYVLEIPPRKSTNPERHLYE